MPKRTKATKITDKNKAWNRKKKPSSYKVDSVEPHKTLLIVCEGQTEALYFGAFPVVTLNVKTVDLGGQSKSKLVEMTEKIEKGEDYDEIWCVFDMDYKGDVANMKEDYDNAIVKALGMGYKVAYSNDAFELWFYLHFEYTDQQHHRSFYYQQLSSFFDINYEKIGKTYGFCAKNYERLLEDVRSSQAEAIRRAEKLFLAQHELKYHAQNPVTLVYELVVELNKHLKR